MTTFWNHLAEVAKGQLFAGGHLSPSIVAELATKRARGNSTCKNKPPRDRHLPWPRLAIPH